MKIGTLQRPVFVKRYAGRHLHRPAIGAHLTRQKLITMATSGEKFVIDAQSGEGVTTHSQRPIIVEH
jgi:polyhydroxyalkanoate synthesis regulator protein